MSRRTQKFIFPEWALEKTQELEWTFVEGIGHFVDQVSLNALNKVPAAGHKRDLD